MDQRAFEDLMREIESLGYEREVAARYAAAIGDMPRFDSEGNVVIVKNRKIIATIKGLTFFGEGTDRDGHGRARGRDSQGEGGRGAK
jgi:hypothetical protein